MFQRRFFRNLEKDEKPLGGDTVGSEPNLEPGGVTGHALQLEIRLAKN